MKNLLIVILALGSLTVYSAEKCVRIDEIKIEKVGGTNFYLVRESSPSKSSFQFQENDEFFAFANESIELAKIGIKTGKSLCIQFYDADGDNFYDEEGVTSVSLK